MSSRSSFLLARVLGWFGGLGFLSRTLPSGGVLGLFARVFAAVGALGLVSVLGLAACGSAVMTTEGYSKACIQDADCISVFAGPVCGCSCTTEVLAKSEQERYNTEYQAKQKGCGQLPLCAPCPEPPKVVCKAALCARSSP